MNRDSLGDSYNANSVGKGNGSDCDRLRNRWWDKQQLVGLLEGEISSVDSVDAMNHLEQFRLRHRIWYVRYRSASN